jgi:hypothetical protein
VLKAPRSGLERRALKAIARRTVALAGRDAATRFGLPKSGSTQVAVERLFRDGTCSPTAPRAAAGGSLTPSWPPGHAPNPLAREPREVLRHRHDRRWAR